MSDVQTQRIAYLQFKLHETLGFMAQRPGRRNETDVSWARHTLWKAEQEAA